MQLTSKLLRTSYALNGQLSYGVISLFKYLYSAAYTRGSDFSLCAS